MCSLVLILFDKSLPAFDSIRSDETYFQFWILRSDRGDRSFGMMSEIDNGVFSRHSLGIGKAFDNQFDLWRVILCLVTSVFRSANMLADLLQ